MGCRPCSGKAHLIACPRMAQGGWRRASGILNRLSMGYKFLK